MIPSSACNFKVKQQARSTPYNIMTALQAPRSPIPAQTLCLPDHPLGDQLPTPSMPCSQSVTALTLEQSRRDHRYPSALLRAGLDTGAVASGS